VIKKKDRNQEDKKIWEDYIKNPSDIYDKDQDKSNNIYRRERFKFDLHGFTLDEANNKVKEIIEALFKNKFKNYYL
jgi:DNA-nicking Smr family endonuclease